MMEYISKFKLEIYSIFIVMILYVLNKTCLIHCMIGNIQMFFQCYFNDLLAPILLLNLLVIIFKYIGIELNGYLIFILIGIVAGLCWEYIIPIIKLSSVSDINDLVCYFIGSNIYCLVHKIYYMSKGQQYLK